MIIGVDYHPSFQTIAFLMEETGECGEQELKHSDGQAEKFYRDLKQRGICVRVGMEATGYSRWFERLLAELGFELWIGDPAEIKTKRVKKQKTDRNDARLLRRLMLENNFPQIWVLNPENRDLRQLLWNRHRLVQMRTRIMNQLQALAMNEGYRWKKKLFSEQGRAQLEKLTMRRHKSIAKVAMGRRLAIRLYWMWRNGCEYSQSLEFGSYAGQLGIGHGAKSNAVHLIGHPAP
jgi:transposase